jgi:hypothetical protein
VIKKIVWNRNEKVRETCFTNLTVKNQLYWIQGRFCALTRIKISLIASSSNYFIPERLRYYRGIFSSRSLPPFRFYFDIERSQKFSCDKSGSRSFAPYRWSNPKFQRQFSSKRQIRKKMIYDGGRNSKKLCVPPFERKEREISSHKSRDRIKALPEHPEASPIVNIFV